MGQKKITVKTIVESEILRRLEKNSYFLALKTKENLIYDANKIEIFRFWSKVFYLNEDKKKLANFFYGDLDIIYLKDDSRENLIKFFKYCKKEEISLLLYFYKAIYFIPNHSLNLLEDDLYLQINLKLNFYKKFYSLLNISYKNKN